MSFKQWIYISLAICRVTKYQLTNCLFEETTKLTTWYNNQCKETDDSYNNVKECD